jgi:hypothetical protein
MPCAEIVPSESYTRGRDGEARRPSHRGSKASPLEWDRHAHCDEEYLPCPRRAVSGRSHESPVEPDCPQPTLDLVVWRNSPRARCLQRSVPIYEKSAAASSVILKNARGQVGDLRRVCHGGFPVPLY